MSPSFQCCFLDRPNFCVTGNILKPDDFILMKDQNISYNMLPIASSKQQYLFCCFYTCLFNNKVLGLSLPPSTPCPPPPSRALPIMLQYAYIPTVQDMGSQNCCIKDMVFFFNLAKIKLFETQKGVFEKCSPQ